jgi:hypothetical protein
MSGAVQTWQAFVMILLAAIGCTLGGIAIGESMAISRMRFDTCARWCKDQSATMTRYDFRFCLDRCEQWRCR